MELEVFFQLHGEVAFAIECRHNLDWHSELMKEAGIAGGRKYAVWPAAPKGLMDNEQARFLLAF
jgi:hypothetical protein